jgi:hypothetical protein
MGILKLLAEFIWLFFISIPLFLLVSFVIGLIYTIVYVKNSILILNKKLTKKN